MCSRKGARRCDALIAIREEALAEWCKAETFDEVQTAWRRLGGRVTFHRYGVEHFRRMARVRWSA